MQTSTKRLVAFLLTTTAVLTIFTGCRQSSSSSEDGPPDLSNYHPTPTPATDFERKLQYIREGHFAHVWVITRLDGQPFTREDGDLIRAQAPKMVDVQGTDDKKTYVGGSNFDIEPKQMAALKKRLKFEDYSGK